MILKETWALLGWGDFGGWGQKGCKEAKGIKTDRETEREGEWKEKTADNRNPSCRCLSRFVPSNIRSSRWHQLELRSHGIKGVVRPHIGDIAALRWGGPTLVLWEGKKDMLDFGKRGENICSPQLACPPSLSAVGSSDRCDLVLRSITCPWMSLPEVLAQCSAVPPKLMLAETTASDHGRCIGILWADSPWTFLVSLFPFLFFMKVQFMKISTDFNILGTSMVSFSPCFLLDLIRVQPYAPASTVTVLCTPFPHPFQLARENSNYSGLSWSITSQGNSVFPLGPSHCVLNSPPPRPFLSLSFFVALNIIVTRLESVLWVGNDWACIYVGEDVSFDPWLKVAEIFWGGPGLCLQGPVWYTAWRRVSWLLIGAHRLCSSLRSEGGKLNSSFSQQLRILFLCK